MSERRGLRLSIAGLLAISFLFMAVAALAEERRLDAAEIETMLTGRTAMSMGGGAAYRQHFSPSGATTYASEGGSP